MNAKQLKKIKMPPCAMSSQEFKEAVQNLAVQNFANA